jgi:hypothetical protein
MFVFLDGVGVRPKLAMWSFLFLGGIVYNNEIFMIVHGMIGKTMWKDYEIIRKQADIMYRQKNLT